MHEATIEPSGRMKLSDKWSGEIVVESSRVFYTTASKYSPAALVRTIIPQTNKDRVRIFMVEMLQKLQMMTTFHKDTDMLLKLL